LLVHDLIKTAVNQKKITVYQENAIRTIFHVEKIARFTDYCIQNWKYFSNETFNLGHESGNISKKEIVSKIKKFVAFETTASDQVDLDKRDYVVSYEKLNKIWKQSPMNLDKTFEEIASYYKYQKMI
jgi:nucleoside-diphosphate-sugar epimerase